MAEQRIDSSLAHGLVSQGEMLQTLNFAKKYWLFLCQEASENESHCQENAEFMGT